MLNDKLYTDTVNKFNELITEIFDDRLLLSSLCGFLKNEYGITCVITENEEQEQKVLYDNCITEHATGHTTGHTTDEITKHKPTSLKSDFIMLGIKYQIILSFKSNNKEITTEYFNYLITVLILIVKNIKTSDLELEESNIKDVKNVLNRLSFTELSVILKIFNENDCEEFTIVASKVAQKHDLTRSSIVNALRKLESAMIIESYSLGVKGTHIKIINNYFRKEISKLN